MNYIPGNGGPIPGETRFRVYEAAKGPHKVVVSEYLLRDDPDHPIEHQQKLFRGKLYDTDVVTVRRISYCDPVGCKNDGDEVTPDKDAYKQYLSFAPYTYINPIDVVLVIDRSPSMFTIDPGESKTGSSAKLLNAAK